MAFRLSVAVIAYFALAYKATAAAPNVTGLSCLNHDGQTFCTYVEPLYDPSWATYRYKLYESTSPVTALNPGTLVESGLFDNGGQLDGTAAYNQTTRQDRTQR